MDTSPSCQLTKWFGKPKQSSPDTVANNVASGTYTSSQFPQPKQISPDQCTQNVQTTGNACLTDRQTYKDGGWFPWTKQSTIRGDTVFVRTDCSNRQRLPLDQQDPAYNNPGVSLDQGLYDGYAAFWENGIENQATALVMNDANTQCAKGTVATAPHAQYDHCVDAISQILQEPYNTMPVLGKNDQQTVMVRSIHNSRSQNSMLTSTR